MNDIEIEIAILKKYIEQHKLADDASSKCARELDMREVLKGIIGDESQDLEYDAKLWFNRLAPRSAGKSKGVLRPCSDSTILNTTHKFHARAYTDVVNDQPAPAWDRISALEEKLLSARNNTKEPKDVLLLTPNVHGIGIDLREAWKRVLSWFKK